MKIITGATGATHVTSNNDGEFNQAIFGEGLVVLANGNKLEARIVDNNTIEIADGDLVFQGRHALIEPSTSDTITISTGTIEKNRNDLIIARYALDSNTGYESLTLEVLEGKESTGTASDPSITEGDIRTGATLAEVALYRVRIEGINIVALDKLFEPLDGPVGQSGDFVKAGETIGFSKHELVNADMLGGYEASYYATNTALEKLKREGAMPHLDFSNPIFEFTTTTKEYTATEDCYLFGTMYSSTAESYLYLNNRKISTYGDSFYSMLKIMSPLKLAEGDTVKIDTVYSEKYNGFLAVYKTK